MSRLTFVRARLTLWYTLVLFAPLVAFAIVSYAIVSRAMHSRTDAFIADALTVFSRELVSERRMRPTVPNAIQATISEVRFRHLDIAVVDDSSRVIAVSGPYDDSGESPTPISSDSTTVLASVVSARARDSSAHTLRLSSGAYRVFVRHVPIEERVFRLAGIYPLTDVETTLARIRQLWMIAIPLLVVAAATGGWFLAGRSLVPVERSFEQQRRFMADASHELRTPAAVLRTEADVTLARDHRSEAEYRESMTVVQEAARRLTRIVDDIFLLARADAGHLVMHPAPLYVEDLLNDMVRAVRPIADKKHVRVELTSTVEAPTNGDADLLGRVVLNLLDNAIKHSTDGGVVGVRLAERHGMYEVTVVDAGSGIPKDVQDRVFERFFRADTARSRAESSVTSGAGLGLAIGRRIAELHGGWLDLASSQPGHTEFRLTLPPAV